MRKANFVYETGTVGDVKMADGTILHVGSMSTEKKLIDVGNGGDMNTSIVLDRLYFHSGSAEITAASEEQVKNIAGILKAYPAIMLKLGGYTDNTGDAAANMKLSQDRADAAKGCAGKAGHRWPPPEHCGPRTG